MRSIVVLIRLTRRVAGRASIGGVGVCICLRGRKMVCGCEGGTRRTKQEIDLGEMEFFEYLLIPLNTSCALFLAQIPRCPYSFHSHPATIAHLSRTQAMAKSQAAFPAIPIIT